jgi:hypothetical protein
MVVVPRVLSLRNLSIRTDIDIDWDAMIYFEKRFNSTRTVSLPLKKMCRHCQKHSGTQVTITGYGWAASPYGAADAQANANAQERALSAANRNAFEAMLLARCLDFERRDTRAMRWFVGAYFAKLALTAVILVPLGWIFSRPEMNIGPKAWEAFHLAGYAFTTVITVQTLLRWRVLRRSVVFL